ncbi:hypothetical protein [Caulifigura coniformis]|nr:hypothetical protein [Caulifigura coniformis]
MSPVLLGIQMRSFFHGVWSNAFLGNTVTWSTHRGLDLEISVSV